MIAGLIRFTVCIAATGGTPQAVIARLEAELRRTLS
jgi:hypothetical protein